LDAAGRLKRLKRAGWVRVGVPEPESVADHSYRLALLALLLGPRLGLNVEELVRLALLHDLAEARVGDLTPADGIPPDEKQSRETAAFGEIVEAVPEGPELRATWREYEQGAGREARAVRQLDKLEMALQALEYEQAIGRDPEKFRKESTAGASLDGQGSAESWADEFWDSARAAITDPLLVELFQYLQTKRPVG
jgi:putative hydrolase of HD superfamily